MHSLSHFYCRIDSRVSTIIQLQENLLTTRVPRVHLFSNKSYLHTKGQIISKGLFDVLEFSQKTNERIRRSSKNEFVCSFFGRIHGYQKSFRNYLTFKVLKTLMWFDMILQTCLDLFWSSKNWCDLIRFCQHVKTCFEVLKTLMWFHTNLQTC